METKLYAIKSHNKEPTCYKKPDIVLNRFDYDK